MKTRSLLYGLLAEFDNPDELKQCIQIEGRIEGDTQFYQPVELPMLLFEILKLIVSHKSSVLFFGT